MLKILLTCTLVAAAAAPALAQNKFTATTNRDGSDKGAAIIRAQAARIASLTQQGQALQDELTKRQACENIGRLYINGHASADAQGCVDPANF